MRDYTGKELFDAIDNEVKPTFKAVKAALNRTDYVGNDEISISRFYSGISEEFDEINIGGCDFSDYFWEPGEVDDAVNRFLELLGE